MGPVPRSAAARILDEYGPGLRYTTDELQSMANVRSFHAELVSELDRALEQLDVFRRDLVARLTDPLVLSQ